MIEKFGKGRLSSQKESKSANSAKFYCTVGRYTEISFQYITDHHPRIMLILNDGMANSFTINKMEKMTGPLLTTTFLKIRIFLRRRF